MERLDRKTINKIIDDLAYMSGNLFPIYNNLDDKCSYENIISDILDNINDALIEMIFMKNDIRYNTIKEVAINVYKAYAGCISFLDEYRLTSNELENLLREFMPMLKNILKLIPGREKYIVVDLIKE